MRRFTLGLIAILLITPFTQASAQLCGDVNNSSTINIADLVYYANYLFRGGAAPAIRLDSASIDSIPGINHHDPVRMSEFLFLSGTLPYCPPYPADSILPITSDTLEIRGNTVNPGLASKKVDLWFHSKDDLRGYSLAFKFWCATSSLVLDSVSFVGSAFAGNGWKEDTLFPVLQKGVIASLSTISSGMTSDSGLLASLWFSISPSLETQYINIDTTQAPPSNITIFSRNTVNTGYKLIAFIPTMAGMQTIPEAPTNRILIYSTQESGGALGRHDFDEDLPSTLAQDGFTVRVYDRQIVPEIVPETLANYGQLWVISTETAGIFSANEVTAIQAFRNSGNGVFIIGDDAPYDGPANQLSSAWGVTFSGPHDHCGGPIGCQIPTSGFAAHDIWYHVGSIQANLNEGYLSSVVSPSTTIASHDGLAMVAVRDSGCTRVAWDASFYRFYDATAHPNLSILSFDNARYARNMARWLQVKDSDADGTCDGLDPCPFDPTDDGDGDGICGIPVSNINNSGIGSFPWAMFSANSNPGADTIVFSVSETFQPSTPLNAIVDDSTLILGGTAPGGAHSIILDGSLLSSGHGISIASSHNRIIGLTVSNFPGDGIAITGASSTNNQLTHNLIHGNGGLAIDLGNDGPTANDPGDGDAGPNNLLNYPTMDSVRMNPDSSFIVYGKTDDFAAVEFYLAHPVGDTTKPADPSEHGEAYAYIGATASSQPGPTHSFTFVIPKAVGQFSQITMMAIDSGTAPNFGNTSELSTNIVLVPQPLIVVAYSPVNIIVTDPLGRRFGRDAFGTPITEIPEGEYYEAPNDSVVIPKPLMGEYQVGFVAEDDAPPGATFSAIIRVDGTAQLVLAAEQQVPQPGVTATYPYDVEEGYHYPNGDGNDDGNVNVADAVFIINYVFKFGPAPNPVLAGDANCDHGVNVADAVYLINRVFKNGPPPCEFTP